MNGCQAGKGRSGRAGPGRAEGRPHRYPGCQKARALESNGYLQADALAQYECLFGPEAAKHCCCWAHCRRKFVVAADGGDERAEVPLGLIGRLYGLEKEMPALLPPSDDPTQQEQRRQREQQRRQARQEQARPILDTLKKWLDEERPKVLPKSPLGVAIGYALNNWEALCRYVEEGYLPIDNNLSERTLRVVAVGRNNWGVLGSETGGESAAVLYSVVQTCRHLGIDPFAYLREALPGIFALGENPSDEQLLAWLPDRWQAARPGLPVRGRDGVGQGRTRQASASPRIRVDPRAAALRGAVARWPAGARRAREGQALGPAGAVAWGLPGRAAGRHGAESLTLPSRSRT